MKKRREQSRSRFNSIGVKRIGAARGEMKEEEGQSSQVDRARMKDLEMEYSKCYVYPEDMGLCRKKEFLALQNAAVAENYLKKSAQTSFICSLRALRNCLLFLSHFQEAWMKENVK